MLIAGLAALVACQPLPRPFKRDPSVPNPLLSLADARGIAVVGVDGAPQPMARALQHAMAAALLERHIPASVSSANNYGHFLVANATTEPAGAGRVRVRLIWEVLGGKGHVKGTHRQQMTLPEKVWRDGTAEQAAEIARRAAVRVAAILQEPAPKDARPQIAHRLFVAPVTGGPQAGNRALGGAIARALGTARIAVVPNRGPDDLVIAGTINIGDPVKGRRVVEIVWSVLDGKNVSLGKITQRNAVPSAALRDGWDRLAPAIARNAIGGIRDLLRRLPPPKTASKAAR